MRRLWKLLFFVFVLLPFGFVGALVLTMIQAKTLVKKIDEKWNPAPRVLMWARLWTSFYRDVPLPFLLAILHNEGASTPHPASGNEAAAISVDPGTMIYPVGDMFISKGPALGCGQVLRYRIEKLWQGNSLQIMFPLPHLGLRVSVRSLVVYDSPYKLALPGNERGAVWACVAALREDLAAAKGDPYEGARRYNGGPVDDTKAEEEYAQRVVDTLERIS